MRELYHAAREHSQGLIRDIAAWHATCRPLTAAGGDPCLVVPLLQHALAGIGKAATFPAAYLINEPVPSVSAASIETYCIFLCFHFAVEFERKACTGTMTARVVE